MPDGYPDNMRAQLHDSGSGFVHIAVPSVGMPPADSSSGFTQSGGGNLGVQVPGVDRGGHQGRGGFNRRGGFQGRGGRGGPQGRGGRGGPQGRGGRGGSQGRGGLDGSGGFQGRGGHGSSQARGGFDGSGGFQGRGGRGGSQGRGGFNGNGGFDGHGSSQARGGFHGRGGYQSRGGFNGRGRGRGRGGFNQNRDNHQRDQSDGADLHPYEDIKKYFWGDEEDAGSPIDHSSTFHDSKENPNKLNHVLLFKSANPRWVSDQIIFARSKLDLLPDYVAKKEERGEWKTPTSSEDGSTEAKTAGSGANEAAGNDALNSATPTATESEADTATDGNIDSATYGKVDVATEGKVDAATKNEVGTATEGEAGAATEAGAHHASLSIRSRMTFSDVRNLPVEEQKRLEEEQKLRQQRQQPYQQTPSYPNIDPIDYFPSVHGPIAVFEQRRRSPEGPLFAFAGWFKIHRINILAPHSAELLRMQLQKWERRDRSGKIVQTHPRNPHVLPNALRIEWAVVKMVKLTDDEAPALPKLEKSAAQSSENGIDKDKDNAQPSDVETADGKEQDNGQENGQPSVEKADGQEQPSVKTADGQEQVNGQDNAQPSDVETADGQEQDNGQQNGQPSVETADDQEQINDSHQDEGKGMAVTAQEGEAAHPESDKDTASDKPGVPESDQNTSSDKPATATEEDKVETPGQTNVPTV
ncbi:hypothetical protein GGR54DRAFT_319732 [Hypoxylon sp. NC1633]|nr:hypothetical protein GGR54DRAFT_319732 [Hypoxylon sp. NC1633]